MSPVSRLITEMPYQKRKLLHPITAPAQSRASSGNKSASADHFRLPAANMTGRLKRSKQAALTLFPLLLGLLRVEVLLLLLLFLRLLRVVQLLERVRVPVLRQRLLERLDRGVVVLLTGMTSARLRSPRRTDCCHQNDVQLIEVGVRGEAM